MAGKERLPGGFAVIVTRLAALWVLVGAGLKLFLGTPYDLPDIVQQLPLDLVLTYQIAIAAELTIGVLAMLKPRWAWLLILTLLLLFDVALITQVREGASSCGCFGSAVTVPPVAVLVVDSLLIVLLLVSRPWASLGRDGIHALALAMLLAVVIPLPWLLDRSSAADDAPPPIGRGFVALEVAKWPGTRLEDHDVVRLKALEGLPREGIWIFYRNTCPVCADLLQYMSSAEWGERPVVLVRMPDTPGEELLVHDLPEGPWVHRRDLPDDRDWVGPTPMGVVVKDGCVIWAKEAMEIKDHTESLDPPHPVTCD